jgi:hypothetical protein
VSETQLGGKPGATAVRRGAPGRAPSWAALPRRGARAVRVFVLPVRRCEPARRARFQQGPSSITYDFLTIGLSGLPGNARSIYQELEGGDPVVAWIPFGSGTVVALGWDWYDAIPRGSQDGGWLDVLGRAVQGEARAVSTRTVAVYYDDGYVDLVDDDPAEAEAINVEDALASLGHLPARFFGTDLLSFQQAFEAAEVVQIPELEQGDLAAALPAEVKQALADYVAAGGVLIVHGDGSGRFAMLLNAVFGFATTIGDDLSFGQLARSPGLEYTRFDGGVTNLYGFDGTTAISGLPEGALAVYESPQGHDGVVRIPYGAGKIIFLGWDWYDAAPRGNADEGWRFVLDRAVLEAPLPAPEPGRVALALAATATLAWKRNRRRQRVSQAPGDDSRRRPSHFARGASRSGPAIDERQVAQA